MRHFPTLVVLIILISGCTARSYYVVEDDVPVPGFFGTGSDGDTVVSAGIPVTITRNMFYKNLVVMNGAVLDPSGFIIFVNETLTLNGSIKVTAGNGGNATVPVGGAACVWTPISNAQYEVPVGLSGTAGGTGTTTAGSPGGASLAQVACHSGVGKRGAKGGNGTGGTGGTGGTVGSCTTIVSRNFFSVNEVPVGVVGVSGSGATGGGGGGGNGVNPGGGGGGGACHSPDITIYARNVVLGSHGILSAIGGRGGNGADASGSNTGGGGGGSGGNGGIIKLYYHKMIDKSGYAYLSDLLAYVNITRCYHGEQGSGGRGVGTGTKGGTGSDGLVGVRMLFNMADQSVFYQGCYTDVAVP